MKYGFLISHLSLEEKASLMSGLDTWNTKCLPGQGIPSMRLSDGPHGLRVQDGRDMSIKKGGSLPATCLPTASALANSWDEEMLAKTGELLGTEALADEVGVLLGPGVCIKRNPLCGRNFEYFSEDPFLSGKLGAAMIRGIQSKGVSACVKHFAANSQETLRMTSDSLVDERTLRELYLPAFEMAVKEGNVNCLMTAYNKINGTYANENTHLLRDILYDEWKYKGMVVSDWGGNNDRVEAIKAGSTLEMPGSYGITDKHIVDAVRAGRLDEKLLDEQVDRLLCTVFSTRKAIDAAPKRFDRYKHHMFAADMAAETAVLLKNEDGILPLNREKTVAVIGDFAENPHFQGEGSSMVNPWNPLSPLECIKKSGLKLSGYAKGYERNGKRGSGLIKEAVRLASESDAVILYLGLPESGEAEGKDRKDLNLPDNQLRLVRSIAGVNKNIVAVLCCGCVVDMSWDDCCKAVVHGFLPGQAGALAMSELLTGKRNFSGKLAETYPLKYSDEPSAPYYPGNELTAEYREGIYVGYRYFDSAGVPVKYPFGYGLSYTSFEYSGLKVSENRAVFKVKNTGSVPGTEIAQLYVSAKTGGMFRPSKELKGFCRVQLEPGEEKELQLPLNSRSFAVWSTENKKWLVESGNYDILVGASVEDIRLGACLRINGDPVDRNYSDEIFTAYRGADAQSVSGGAFSAVLGRKLPASKWDRSLRLEENDAVLQGQYLSGGFGRALFVILSLVQTLLNLNGNITAGNNINFILNITYRGLARLVPFIGDDNLDTFLDMVNGEPLAVKKLIKQSLK